MKQALWYSVPNTFCDACNITSCTVLPINTCNITSCTVLLISTCIITSCTVLLISTVVCLFTVLCIIFNSKISFCQNVINIILFRIIHVVCGVFYKQLSTWILHGMLKDQYGEFFIEKAPDKTEKGQGEQEKVWLMV